ncbi:ABC transporter ATP-binding protein [Brevundimonas sp. Leaf363]|uniref:ABC transporter ATP-binding protein n=1 Tax=Brevundimonas sp. Leaf363 TaxID=1736353 RepID=UPI0006F88B10|nr:ABC transporter ATP-binding protein [Brevundimonas sp. Leaf363]
MESEATPALVLRGVEAGYERRAVLQGFNLTVQAREVYALLGANGAGKSTVVRVACGLLPARRGSVQIGGGTHEIARIGLAPQEIALFPALSPRENVEVTAQLCRVPARQRGAAVDRALHLTGCDPRADQPVRTLSGGWRRRANLAAALVGQPALLIADEPTEGVDAATRNVLAQALRTMADDGAGCLLISHDALFVADVADRIGVMAQGRLIAEGAPQDLVETAFGADRLLDIRFARPASSRCAGLLTEAGLVQGKDGLTWSRSTSDALTLAQALAPDVDAEDGEIIVRRPGLDDLVTHLSGRQP